MVLRKLYLLELPYLPMPTTQRICTCLCSLFLSFFATSQNFQEALQKAHDAQNPNSSLEFLRSVESELPEVNDSSRIQFYLGLGIAYGQLGVNDSSLIYLDQAEEIAQKNSSDRPLIDVWNTKGLVYMATGNFDQSLDYYQKALKIAESRDDQESKTLAIRIIGNAAGVFYQIGDLPSAIDYMNRAIEFSKKIGLSHGLGVSYLRMAILYKDLDSLSQSIKHLETSNQLLEEEQDTIMLLYSKNTLGGIYQKQRQYLKALQEFKESENLAVSISNTEDIVFAKASIADLYLNIGQHQLAEQNAREVLTLATTNQLTDRISQAHDILYRIYLDQGDYQEALTHRNDYITIKDSISNVEVKSKIAELEAKYEAQKKEAEIERLTLENSLHEANLARNRTALIATIAGGLLLIILLVVFFVLRHKKHQAEKEAQELQLEALKKRLFEIQIDKPSVNLLGDLDGLNKKLHNDLTEREFEILKLSLESKTNSEIAEELFISVSTVKFHLRNTYSKLGVNNRKEALDYVAKKA